MSTSTNTTNKSILSRIMIDVATCRKTVLTVVNTTTTVTVSCPQHRMGMQKKEHLIQVYTANINSTMEYAGFCWMASAGKAHLERLERTLNKIIRKITGQYMATTTEAMRFQCGLPSLQTQMNRIVMKTAEKAVTLPKHHPRRLAFEHQQPPRIKKPLWRSKSTDMRFLFLNMENRTEISHFKYPSWTDAPCWKSAQP